MKIKRTVEMNLHELIKHIFDNGIEDANFWPIDHNGYHISQFEVRSSGSGNIKIIGYINKDSVFKVEIEEEIKENTIFDMVYIVSTDETRKNIWLEEQPHNSIKQIKDWYGQSALSIHTIIGNDLVCIWEAD